VVGWVDGGSLGIRIRVAFGASIAADPSSWTWTDVTQWWHASMPIEVHWGRSAGAERPEPSTLALALQNTDGRFSPDSGASPYWPHVRTWTPISLDVDLGDGAGWINRFSGYVRSWSISWPGDSALMALTRVEAVGILGRLGRGNPPVWSPLRRAIGGAQHSGLLAYWPGEDVADSTRAGSAVSGVAAMTVTGAAKFADVTPSLSSGATLRLGASRIINLNGGASLNGRVPPGSSTPVQWSVQFGAQVDAFAVGADVPIVEWATPGGTLVRWRVVQTTSFTVQVIAYTASGAATTLLTATGVFTGFAEYTVTAAQSGSDVQVRFLEFGEMDGSATLTGHTLARVTDLTANPDRVATAATFGFGHAQVWDTAAAPSFADLWLAARGELAHDRIARLCAEDGVPLTIPPVDEADGIIMGSQQDGELLELLRECEATDQGLLYEDGWGLGYLPRVDRYNAPVELTIDGGARELGGGIQPVADDQALRNRWEVSRVGGSSAVAEDADSIAVAGIIDASAEINLDSDDTLAHHAHWRLHTTTSGEPRYQSIAVNLGVARHLAPDWVRCRPGSRIQIVSPPAQAGVDTIDQLIVGAREVISRRSWRVTPWTVPARPWQVAEVDGEQRVASDGSSLAADLAADGMTLVIASTGVPWVTDPAYFPLELRVGGERITVSAISGSSSPQTATVAPGGRTLARAWPAGTEVQVWAPATVAL